MTNRVVPTAKLNFGLAGHELAAAPGKNVLVSGLSVTNCLGMVLNGARGETRREMIQALALDFGHNDDDNEFNNDAYAAMIDSLEDDQLGVAFTIANAIYARAGETRFVPEFIELSRHYFKATVSVENFDLPSTVVKINENVATATRGLIKEIIKSLSPDDVMLLVNCIYFKGEWKNKFDIARTKDATFYAASGEKQHPLMFRQADTRVVKTDAGFGVALPFGKNEDRFNQYFLLPVDGASVEDVVASLTPESLDGMIQRRWKDDVRLWLPKFQISSDITLNETLEKLGMKKALNPGADLSGLIDAGAFISEVKHKTVLKVTEEGAEAAAVTSARVSLESCIVRNPVEVRIDRPFVTLIVDDANKTVAFTGVVNDPEKIEE